MIDHLINRTRVMVSVLETNLKPARRACFISQLAVLCMGVLMVENCLSWWGDFQRPVRWVDAVDAGVDCFCLILNCLVLRRQRRTYNLMRTAHRNFSKLVNAEVLTVSMIDHHIEQAVTAIDKL